MAYANQPVINWIPPAAYDPDAPGMGFSPLVGTTHHEVYVPMPCMGNVDEGGSGEFENCDHGTYNNNPKLILYQNKLIITWTNHSIDENGPGQRILGRVATFDDDFEQIEWGGSETMVEFAPQPVPIRRRQKDHDPDLICEAYATGNLQVIKGRIYLVGKLAAVHGWTDNLKYHGFVNGPVPAAHWSDKAAPEKGFKWDVWWDLGGEFVQEWQVFGDSMAPAGDMYLRSERKLRIEVCPGRFKDVFPVDEPYATAEPFTKAPAAMQQDLLYGKPKKFTRTPKYKPGTARLAADGLNGLGHHTEFKRPDNRWVVIRENLLNRGYYYAALKHSEWEPYPPAAPTNLPGGGMPVAGELPDGSCWIIGNSDDRKTMYITVSSNGVNFDRTWLLQYIDREGDGGMHKFGGPQFFQAVVLGKNIWVTYSITKEQIGATQIPMQLLS